MVIACYNGEDVISETIEHVARHVPKDQILVVSDASTDRTAEVASIAGVRVIVNEKNQGKAFSINEGVSHVETPYVLILDDDVLIGKATIPTSLLDDGYTAVAFNVMPVKTETFVNALQMFEYRNSMHLGKNLRGSVGAIGNISGAIGLYRTADLVVQGRAHSGQFGGEDEQRTLLAHMYGTGKGVTYANELVQTHVPAHFHSLYRQRAYSWSLAAPEMFTFYWRILFSTDHHYLLKAEKAYYLYIYLTDPLRLLFLWALILRPRYLLVTFVFYLFVNLLVWFKTKRQDHFLVILAYPFYTLGLTLCRFIGNFYWFKVKATYFLKRLHRRVPERKLVREFAFILIIFLASWAISAYRFTGDVRLFNKIRSTRLEEEVQAFEYENTSEDSLIEASGLNLKVTTVRPLEGSFLSVELEKGDTARAIAHKAVSRFIESHPELRVPYEYRTDLDADVLTALQNTGVFITNSSLVLVDINAVDSLVRQTAERASET